MCPLTTGDNWASEVREIVRSIARYAPAPAVLATSPPARGVPRKPYRQWPAPLSEAAFSGLPGEFVRLVEPHTEADPPALLFQFLAAMGQSSGAARTTGPELISNSNLFMAIVGNSAKERKGMSWGEVRRICELAEIAWTKTRITNGLTSGEGPIHAVRDEITELVAIKKDGRVVDREEQVTDAGEADQRLLCVEAELAQALQGAPREGSTLSAVIRQARDGIALRVLPKAQTQAVRNRISPSLAISRGQNCKSCSPSPTLPKALPIAFFGWVRCGASICPLVER